jgi:hypothetical protein
MKDTSRITKAQKELKRTQIIGIIIYLILAYAKRYPFWNYQFELITLLASINAFFVMKNVIFIAQQKQHILNYSKVKWLLWICGGYAVLLLLLSVLELWMKHYLA